jgi:hypothetical protein
MIRRAIGTTLAGLCALTGPLAGGSFAATTVPDLSASVTSARPGVAFTVSPTAAGGGCPATSGAQTVDLTFTDSAGVVHFAGSIDTDANGTWTTASVQLPVAGLDESGVWSNVPVAAGAGTLGASCITADDSDASDDSGADDSDDPSESDDSDDSGDSGDDATDPGDDDTGDPDGVPDQITRTYTGITFTTIGTAPKLTLSASVLKPGDPVTVTPAEDCAATGASTVEVSLVSLSDAADDGDGEEDNSGDDGDDTSGDDGTDDSSGLPSATATTSATGTWSAVTLVVPADAATGDYAVTADCTSGEAVTSSYDAQPVAVGTVLIGAGNCTAKGATVALTGTYSGEIAGKEGGLPARLTLTGDGPWKVKVRSAGTGQQLAARTVTCAKPQYQLGVSKTGLTASNKPQARVCNTGRAPVSAVLQVLSSKKYQKVDKETLDPGDCVWLHGSKLDQGEQVKAQVLIDAPGKDADEVAGSFTVKRPKH